MEDKSTLPTLEIVEGEPYDEPKKKWWDETKVRTDYVKFTWSTGFLLIQKYEFDKNKKLRKQILDTILGREEG